jgi:hypothetical protein
MSLICTPARIEGLLGILISKMLGEPCALHKNHPIICFCSYFLQPQHTQARRLGQDARPGWLFFLAQKIFLTSLSQQNQMPGSKGMKEKTET